MWGYDVFERIREARRTNSFTLIELLIVIFIWHLRPSWVFGVSGITSMATRQHASQTSRTSRLPTQRTSPNRGALRRHPTLVTNKLLGKPRHDNGSSISVSTTMAQSPCTALCAGL